MTTQYTDIFTSANVATAIPSLAVYPLPATSSIFYLSWPDQNLPNPTAVNTIFTGSQNSSPVVYLPPSLGNSYGANGYIWNLNTATVSGGVYASAQAIALYTYNGVFIGNIAANGIVSLIIVGTSTTNELSNWQINYLGVPSSTVQSLTTFIQLSSGNGVNGLGLSTTGYIYQQQNVIVETNSGSATTLTISALNGNDLYILSGNPYTTIALPVDGSPQTYLGRLISFKNLNTNVVNITAPGGYYIDANISQASSGTTVPVGNSSITLYPNESITIGYAGNISFASGNYNMYLIVTDTASYSSMYKGFIVNLPTTLSTELAPVVINQRSALVSDVIEFDVPSGAAVGAYYANLESVIPKVYYVSFVPRGTQLNSVIIGVNGNWTNTVTISNASPLLSFYVNSNGNINLTSLSYPSITYATTGDIDFITQTGTPQKAIGADLFVELLTNLTDTTGARSYPYYLINYILGNLTGILKYKGGFNASLGAAPAPYQTGFWYVVNVGGSFIAYSGGPVISCVAGDWLLCTNGSTSTQYIVLNQARFSLITSINLSATNASHAVVNSDIGTTLDTAVASIGTNASIVFNSPTTYTLPTTNMSDYLAATKTRILSSEGPLLLYLQNSSGATYFITEVSANSATVTEVATDGSSWYVNAQVIDQGLFIQTLTNGSSFSLSKCGSTSYVAAGAALTFAVTYPSPLPSGVTTYGYAPAFFNKPIKLICLGEAFITIGSNTSQISGANGAIVIAYYYNSNLYFSAAAQ